MSNYQTGRDVLEQSRAFHDKLSSFYHILSNKAEQERVKLLLEYLSRHEKRLSRILEDYEDDVSQTVLDTWFHFTQEEFDLSAYWEAAITADMTAAEVVALALRLDERLLDTYRAMTKNQVPEKVREIFENLLQMEEEEVHKLARAELAQDDM